MIREHNFQDQLHNFQDQFCNFQDSPDKAGFKGTESWEGEGEFPVMDKILVMMMMTLLMMLLVVTDYYDDDVADDVAGERVGAGRGCGVRMPLCRNLSKPLQRPF